MAHNREPRLVNQQGVKRAGEDTGEGQPEMIMVNGYWVKTVDFLEDPETYNNRPINPKYLESVLG